LWDKCWSMSVLCQEPYTYVYVCVCVHTLHNLT
jgi:hypothetical protein